MKVIAVLVFVLVFSGCEVVHDKWDDSYDDSSLCNAEMKIKNSLKYDVYIFYYSCGMNAKRASLRPGDDVKIRNLVEGEHILIRVGIGDTIIGSTSRRVSYTSRLQIWDIRTFKIYY